MAKRKKYTMSNGGELDIDQVMQLAGIAGSGIGDTTLGKTASGAATGFATAGPIGAIIGGGAGLIGGLLNKDKKPDAPVEIVPMNSYAMGGDVELEGQELVEDNLGNLKKMQGPSHKEGGIDMKTVSPNSPVTNEELPVGSTVYSKQLKVLNPVTGKRESMATRKLNREKALDKLTSQVEKLGKKLEKRPANSTLKNNLERTQQHLKKQIELNTAEEQKDTEVMNLMNDLDNYMNGGTVDFKNGGKVSYKHGGDHDPKTGEPLGTDPAVGLEELIKQGVNRQVLPENFTVKDLAKALNSTEEEVKLDLEGLGLDLDNLDDSSRDILSAKLFNTFKVPGKGYYNGTPPKSKVTSNALSRPKIESLEPISSYEIGDLTPKEKPYVNPMGTKAKQEVGDRDLTLGDKIGIGSTIAGVGGNLINTLINRANEKDNINFYADYGNEALALNNKVFESAAGTRDNTLDDLQLSANAGLNRNRNSARSVNTLRNLDLATGTQLDEATQKVNNKYFADLSSIFDKRSNITLQRDDKVAYGETQRDIADRHDDDAFATNLSSNITNIADLGQSLGKNLNIHESKVDRAEFNEMLARDSFTQEELDTKYSKFLARKRKKNN